jgi:hypothetical protein
MSMSGWGEEAAHPCMSIMYEHTRVLGKEAAHPCMRNVRVLGMMDPWIDTAKSLPRECGVAALTCWQPRARLSPSFFLREVGHGSMDRHHPLVAREVSP